MKNILFIFLFIIFSFTVKAQKRANIVVNKKKYNITYAYTDTLSVGSIRYWSANKVLICVVHKNYIFIALKQYVLKF